MATIPLSLDGYTDLPPGKIANVVTYLELMAFPGAMQRSRNTDLSLRRVEPPELGWYRRMFSRVGEEWLWFSRAVMPDAELRALLGNPAVEVYVPEQEGEALGLAELDRSRPDQVEISIFGVVPEVIGKGVARRFMADLLSLAFAPGVARVWLHTCSFDHPAAIRFYLGCGFRAWKYGVEVSDDPRLTGHLPRAAARHVPLIEPT